MKPAIVGRLVDRVCGSVSPRRLVRATLASFMLAILGRSLTAQAPTDATSRLAAWEQHRRLSAESPWAGVQWTAMGPTINGGRVEAIAVPSGPGSTIYAGMASGGVWKTTNDGISWRQVFRNESSFAIGDVAVAPSNANIVWVGTGEAQPRHSGYAYSGTGVFRSLDAGATWQHMGLTDTHHIGKVVIDPRNPDRVWVAAIGHFWSNNPERGVFATIDGGKHWTRSLHVNDSTGVVDLAIDPSNSDILYAWAWRVPLGRDGGLFKTTNGGRTWRHIAAGLPRGPLGRAGLDVAPSRPNVVYAYIDNQAAGPSKEQPVIGGEVYRSDDRGEHWRKANTDSLYSVFGEFGWKFCDVRVAPDNADEIFILGNRGMHSIDGGKTYTRIGEHVLRLHPTRGHALHLDHHDIWIDPRDANHVLLGNDGGVFSSRDRGRTWLHLNTIPAVQFYFIAAETGAAPYRIFGGTQDNAAVYGRSDARADDRDEDAWQHVYLDRWTGGDSYVTLPDPTDARIVYYEHQNGEIHRMDITGTSVMSGGPSSVPIAPRAPASQAPYRFSWYTPFLVSQHEPHTLYIGGNRILKSIDRGDHWTLISPDLADAEGGLRAVVPSGAVTMLAESPLRAGLLYAGTEGGAIWRTGDDGGQWMNASAQLPKKWVSRVIASAHQTGTVYATLTGYRQDDFRPYVYVSDDSGATWHSIAGNLPWSSVNVIREDPIRPDVLYVGTEQGVYVTFDRGKRWQSLSANLPTVAVHDLVLQAQVGDLLIATYGLGAWKLELTPVSALTDSIRSQALHLFAPRAVTLDDYPWETVPGDRRGRAEATVHYWSAAAAPVTLVVRDSAERTMRTLTGGAGVGAHTVTWDLLDDHAREVRAGRYRVELRAATGRATGELLVRPSRR